MADAHCEARWSCVIKSENESRRLKCSHEFNEAGDVTLNAQKATMVVKASLVAQELPRVRLTGRGPKSSALYLGKRSVVGTEPFIGSFKTEESAEFFKSRLNDWIQSVEENRNRRFYRRLKVIFRSDKHVHLKDLDSDEIVRMEVRALRSVGDKAIGLGKEIRVRKGADEITVLTEESPEFNYGSNSFEIGENVTTVTFFDGKTLKVEHQAGPLRAHAEFTRSNWSDRGRVRLFVDRETDDRWSGGDCTHEDAAHIAADLNEMLDTLNPARKALAETVNSNEASSSSSNPEKKRKRQ